jgi:hypothetical protein
MDSSSQLNGAPSGGLRLARRLCIRFSLRALLAAVFVAALLLATAHYLNNAVAQHTTARTLVQLGAYVAYDDSSEAKDEELSWNALWFNIRHRVTTVALRGGPLSGTANSFGSLNSDPSPEHLMLVATFRHLQHLDLSGCEVANDDLRIYSGLPLESLDLSHTRVTDDGLVEVAKIVTLRELSLTRGEERWPVTLGNPLPHDRLKGPTITDAGVRYLAALPALETLNLRGSFIYRDSIPYLKQIATLRNLDVGRTNLFGEDVAALKAANPNLEVFRW